MKKPAFIRFFGWAFWFLVSLGFAIGLTHGFGAADIRVAGLGVLAWVFSLPCLVVWIIGTLVHAVSKSHAERQAATLAQLVAAKSAPLATCDFISPEGTRCDLSAGHLGPHRCMLPGPRAVRGAGIAG